MKVTFFTIVIVITFLLCLSCTHKYNKDDNFKNTDNKIKLRVDSILQVLDSEIDNRAVYYAEKEKKIETFKIQLSKIASDEEKFHLFSYIFDEYKSFQYDSAYIYAVNTQTIANKLQNKEYILKSQRNLLFCFMSAGLFKEACDIISSVNTDGISDDLKSDYYFQCARLYSHIASYNTSEPYCSDYYDLKNLYCDSAMMFLDSNSYQYHNVKAFKSLSILEHHKKIEIYSNLFDSFEMDNHQTAINASILGWLYLFIGENDKAVYYIALSAIYDTRAAVTETTSKTTLAGYFYSVGDIENAARYINIALEEANRYNARHRKIDINTILPIIEKERLEVIKGQRSKLTISLTLSVILLLFLLIAFIVINKQKNRIKTANTLIQSQFKELYSINEKLNESNEIKDQYIIQALYGKSEYLEIVENLLKKFDRKLKTRQYDDLNFLYKEFNIKTERENVSSMFDKAFLKLFPNFVTEFNDLLKVDARITLDKDENLTPEIRIFALIRLGINENERIAKFLNISVNTIYAYKTKIKNKAIVPKEEFEHHIMRIKKKL